MLNRYDEWGTFVGNRVREIVKLTSPENWNHVPGKLNPADLASRGSSPRELMRSRWWEGPQWLKLPQNQWIFNPPASPWWGGFWERLIQSLLAIRLIKNNSLG